MEVSKCYNSCISGKHHSTQCNVWNVWIIPHVAILVLTAELDCRLTAQQHGTKAFMAEMSCSLFIFICYVNCSRFFSHFSYCVLTYGSSLYKAMTVVRQVF